MFRFFDGNVELWNAAADLVKRENPVFVLFSGDFPDDLELILSIDRNVSHSLVFDFRENFSLELELEVLGFNSYVLTNRGVSFFTINIDLHPHGNVGSSLSVVSS